MSLPLIAKNVEPAGTINERSIGIAVGIEIRPGEIDESDDTAEGLNLDESAISIVSQDDGKSFFRSKNKIEISVGFDIRGPRCPVFAIDYSRGEFGFGGDVSESGCRVLPEQADAALSS